MFNLEQSFVEWRRQMRAAGINNSSVLDELECHLREDVERGMQSGLSGEAAFQAGVKRIGLPISLKREFAKVAPGKWVLLGILKGILAKSFGASPSLRAFTASASRILELARLEAPRLHHNFVGTEHVLLGLLTLENGTIPDVLNRMGVNPEEVRKQVEKSISIFSSEKGTAHLPYTPRVKKALRIAAQEARACKQVCISAEHIFLGLLREGTGVAGRVLKTLGVNIQTARQEILIEMGRSQGGI
jgi:Clp amino terminal domain, pathogenicity island component